MEGRDHGLPGASETEVAWREGKPSSLHDNTLPEHTSDTTHTESSAFINQGLTTYKPITLLIA